jgi:hypothetical protein
MRFPKVTANPLWPEDFARESSGKNGQDKPGRPGIKGETSGCNARAISGRPPVGFLYNGQTAEQADNGCFLPRTPQTGPSESMTNPNWKELNHETHGAAFGRNQLGSEKALFFG